MIESHHKALVAFILLCFFWGTTYMGIKVAVEYMPPFMLSGLRHLLAGAGVLALALMRGHALPDKKAVIHLSILGCLMIVGGNGLLCWSEQYLSSGLTAIICASSPMIITLMSMLFLKDSVQITYKIIVGLLIAISGIVLISYKNINSGAGNEHFLMGVLFILLANFSWGYGAIFYKKHPLKGVDNLMSIAVQMLAGGAINLIISLMAEPSTNLMQIDMRGIYALLYLIVFGSWVGYGSYQYVLSKYPPARISLYTYINTIVAVLLGFLLLNETLTLSILLGMTVTLSGVLLVNYEYQRHKKAIKV